VFDTRGGIPVVLLFTLCVAAPAANPQRARNVIFFVGDGAGLSSLNAASLHGYGEPQALFVQHMPHVAWADTSSSAEWVTDASAAATAFATGHKTKNGLLSESPDGEKWKSLLEYAEEHSLSTGVISNAGITDPVVAAHYAHNQQRSKTAEIFLDALNPRFGDGVDVMIGSRRTNLLEQTAKADHDIAKDLAAHNHAFLDSLAVLRSVKERSRVVVSLDDDYFDLHTAVDEAIRILSANPKGYLLTLLSKTGQTCSAAC
jgi:alkaline phosphatase